jgi:ABC-type Zn uptake system ZnuABC Zn-binding protein ZnuA
LDAATRRGRRRKRMVQRALIVVALAVATGVAGLPAAGCGQESEAAKGALQVMATTSVLADIAQNVAGDRFAVDSLMPLDTDPHAFEPTPGDLRRISQSDLLIVNGAGLEGSLDKYLRDLGTERVVVAAEGLESRAPKVGEPAHEDDEEEARQNEGTAEPDPHFWLDPTLVKSYVDTIAAAFAEKDPEHAQEYERNGAAYKKQLDELDAWIAARVATVPAERRKLIMNHASHGYWADRYGFRIVGAVIPSVSTGAAPTAADLADLLATIARERVPAIFVEITENAALAEQIAADAGITVVDDLLDHSLTAADGAAPTYLAMMKYDTQRIVDALKQ